jgi:hypothetical protein
MTPPSADGGPDDEPGDDEWRFSVEDVSDDADEASGPDDADETGGPDDLVHPIDGKEPEDGGSVFGPRPDEGSLEVVPGDPDLENALFVVLGIATTLLLLLDLIGVL